MLDPARYVDEDVTGADELSLFDEDIKTLTARVARLETGMAWAEDPPSRTRHLISNIEVAADASGLELTVYCNFMVYRSRGETEQDLYVGGREDWLRRVDQGWKIARRRLVLDQNVLPGQKSEHLLLSLPAIEFERTSVSTVAPDACAGSDWPGTDGNGALRRRAPPFRRAGLARFAWVEQSPAGGDGKPHGWSTRLLQFRRDKP